MRCVKLVVVLFLLVSFAASTSAQDSKTTESAADSNDVQPNQLLDKKWHGTWEGTMVSTGATSIQPPVKLVFLIEPMTGSNDLRWRITYGEKDTVLIKDYKLIPNPKNPGRFWIDEQNGTQLRARLVDDVLYSRFKVGPQLLSARYELRGDVLQFEVVSATPVKAGEDDPVQDFEVNVVQAARLKKKPAE